MSKILIIGATGFIGKNLVKKLCDTNHQVIGLGRSDKSTQPVYDNFEYIQCDITKVDDFSLLLEGIDVVIYLAATQTPSESNKNPVADINDNLIPLIKLLEAIKNKSSCRLIFASSGGTVYGENYTIPLTEQAETNPICAYGINKLAADKYLYLYRHLYGIKCVSLRIGNPYGIGQNGSKPQGVIGVFLKNIMENKSINVWGDGEIVRDYIFIDDIITAFIAALQYNGNEIVFNIGTGTGMSVNQIINLLFKVTNKVVPVCYAANRNMDVNKNILSNNLAKVELNWTPRYSIEEGLYATINTINTINKGVS